MRLVGWLFVACLLLLALPGQAFAYIDPGASSMAYQVLVAGALALGFALRRGWRWIGDVFIKRRSSGRDAAASSASASASATIDQNPKS
jgi:hypothetical protein